jgi:hypothetical protein
LDVGVLEIVGEGTASSQGTWSMTLSAELVRKPARR